MTSASCAPSSVHRRPESEPRTAMSQQQPPEQPRRLTVWPAVGGHGYTLTFSALLLFGYCSSARCRTGSASSAPTAWAWRSLPSSRRLRLRTLAGRSRRGMRGPRRRRRPDHSHLARSPLRRTSSPATGPAPLPDRLLGWPYSRGSARGGGQRRSYSSSVTCSPQSAPGRWSPGTASVMDRWVMKWPGAAPSRRSCAPNPVVAPVPCSVRQPQMGEWLLIDDISYR